MNDAESALKHARVPAVIGGERRIRRSSGISLTREQAHDAPVNQEHGQQASHSVRGAQERKECSLASPVPQALVRDPPAISEMQLPDSLPAFFPFPGCR